MSKVIKIQSLKNGSSVIKIKTVANEKYIIVDETGKPLNKLKFVQKNKNLEIYTEVDGKEQQVVTLEDYYAPDMNASVVGLSETSEELAYVYNANDGWSYLESEDTAFGFATPLLGLGAAGAAGAGIAAAGGGGGSDNPSNTQAPVAPTVTVSEADNDGKPTASGVAEPGSTVTVTWPDGTTSTVTADPTTGAYEVESPTVQTNGNITATATDVNGNTSTPTTAPYADTQAPVAPTVTVSEADNDGKPTASGVAEPGSTVTVTWPDGTTSTVTADPTTGAYEVESPTVQTNGNITATATDVNGNTSTPTTAPYADTQAPVAPTVTVSEADNDGKPTASGVAEPGSTVTVTWPDGTTSTVTADPTTGAYTVESPTVQTNGNITATATDVNGNTSTPTTAPYADTQAPVAPTLTVSEADNDGKPTASGVAEPGSTVTVTWPDGTTSTVTADPTTGAYTVESPTVQTNGNITATATDVNGNTSTPTTAPYADTQAPVAPTVTVSEADNDGKPTASGVAEPGSTVTVTWPDGTTSTVTADPTTGAYTVESPTVQTNGNITATATDVNGNTSTPTTAPYADTQAPVAPTVTVSEADNDGKPTASGVAEPGSTVTVTWPDGTTSTVTADPTTGAYTVESPTVQTNGNITATATDVNGNTSTPTTAPYADTQAPIAPTTAISSYDDNAGTITNANSTATTTDDTTPGFNVGAIPSDASSIVLYVDGVEVAATYDSVNGTLTPNTPLAEGTHSITYAYKDANGNTSTQSPAFSLTVDTPPIAPTTAISSYDDNAGTITNANSTATTTDDTTPGFNVGAIPSDASSIVLYVDGVEVAATYDSVNGTLTPNTPLAEGTHSITYAYKDANGNTSTQSPAFSLTVDTPPIAPTTAISSYDDNAGTITNANSTATTTDDTTPGFNVGAIPADASSIVLYVDGVEVAATYNSTTGTLTPNTPLGEGTHSITYAYKDASGNTSAQSPAFSLTVDTTPPATPTTAISSYDDNVGTITNANSTATTTDDTTPGFNVGAIPADASSIVLYVDGVEVAATYNSTTGTLTPNTPLGEGTHSITYAYKDATGNTSAQSPAFSLTVDTTPPATPTTAISSYDDNVGTITNANSTATTTDDTTPGFNVGAIPADASSIVLYVDGVEVAATYNSTTGTLTPNTPLGEGTHSITYAYKDASGNTSAQSPAFSLTVDTTPPATPTTAISSYDDNVGTITNANSTATTTDDTTPGFNVGAIPADASSIVLYVDGVEVAATYNSTTGTLTPNTPLGEGTHSITYAYKDATGNTSAQSPAFSLTVDTPPLAPTTAISSYDDNVGTITNANSTATTTDDTTPGFNVGAIPADASSIVLYVDGVEVAATYNSTTGTLTPNTPLGEGTHSITYAYKDATGNTSAQSPAFSLTVDTPPLAPTTAISSYDDNVGTITNANSTATTTDDTTPGFNVGAIPADASSIVLYVDGVEVAATYDSVNGTLTPNTPLAEGTHSITYAYKDANGNTSTQSPAFSLTVDTPPIAPTTAISSYDDNAGTITNANSTATTTDDTTPGFNVGAIPSDASSIVLYVDGVEVAATYDSVNGTLTPNTPLAEGTHSITYAYKDANGNTSTQSPAFSLTVDTPPIAPTTAISSYDDNAGTITNANSTATTTDDTTPGFNVGAIPSDASSIVLYVDGVEVAATYDSVNGTLTPNTPLAEGTHSITYAYKDANGNTSTQSPAFSLTVDTPPIAPTTAISSYDDNAGTITNANSTATTTDDTTPGFNVGAIPADASSIVLYVDGVEVAATYNSTTGTLTPNTPLGEGTHSITYAYKDASGNTSAQSPAFSLTVDTTPPATPTTAISSYDDNVGTITNANSTATTTDDTTPGFNVGAIPADASSIVLYVDGVEVAATYNSTTGTLTPNTPLGEGTHSITYAYKDATGNTSAQSPAFSLTVDTTPPATPTTAISSYDDNVGTITNANSTATTTDDTTPGFNVGAIPADASSIVLYVDGVEVAATYNSTTGTLTPNTPLGEGTHSITYAYKDASGNTSAQSPAFSLTVDTTPPATPTTAISSYDDNVGTITNANSTATTTDDTTPGFNVGAIPADASSIVLYVDGVEVAATYNSTTGTLTPNTPLGEGTHSITYAYKDASGNTSAQSPAFSLTVDTTPPATPTTAISSYDDNVGTITNANSTATTTDDTTPGFNVGAIPADASSIVLYVDGVEVAATYNSTTGTLTPNAPLAEGTHSITYAYKDANGNTSTQSPAFSLTVDTPPIAPTTAISSYDDNAGTITNANSTATTTDDTTPGFNVGAIPADASSIVLYVDGVEVAATYDAVNGTLTPNTPLAEGTHSITYAYKDASGNTSTQSPAFSLTVDTPPIAPTTAISSYDDNAGTITNANSTATTTDDTTPGFNVGAIPADASSIVLYVDGVEVAATYNSTTGTLTPNTPLGEGTHSITYAYKDASGNTSAQSPAFSLTVDTTPPATPTTAISSYDDNVGTITNANSTATTTDDTTPGFNVGAIPADASSIVLYVDGVEVAATYNSTTGTLTPNTPLGEGTHSITYAYKDATGNTSAQSPAFSLTVDTTPPATPTTAISSYDDNVGTITNANSTATTTDDTTPGFNVGAIPADASSIVLYVDGVEVAATYNSTTGTLTPNTPLGEGTHSITYAYKDASGNTSAQSPAFSLTVDTTPPATPTTAISSYDDNVGTITNANSTATTTDDTTPGFNVGAIPADASSIVLYVDGVEVAATYNSTTGTLTPNTPLGEGTHSITYAYKDASGNTSAQSPAFSLTVDTTPPATPTTAISSYDDNVGTITNANSTATTTDDTTPGFNVGAIPADASSIVLYVDGVEVAATYNSTTGTLTPNAPLAEGTHSITYAYKDANGNTSTQSPAFSLTVDTPPIAPTTAISSYDDNAGTITNANSTATTTDDTTPGFNVGAIPADASSIVLYVDGVEVAATYNSTTGTLTPNTPLGEGTHSITYAYKDATGNTSAQSPAFSLTVDTPPLAPTTAISSYDDNVGTITNANSTATTTDDTTPGFNVGAIPADASSIVLYVDGVEVAATYNSTTGTLTPNTPLGEGTHSITYAYKDASGNTSAQSPAFSLTVDTTPPATPTTAISSYDDNVGTITNANSTATTTDDTTPGFNVGAIPADASSIVLYVDGVEVAATYNSTTGTLTPNAPLAEGTHSITYAYKDANGNTSTQSPAFSLTVDTPPIAPTTAISSYDDNAGTITNATSTATTTDDTTPGFNVGAIPADASSIVLYVDGVEVAATYNSTTGTLTPNTPLGEGTHSITYAYKDASGNTSAQSPAFSLTVDTPPIAPTTAISSYDDNAGTITNANSTATTTDDTTPGFNVGAIPSDASSIVLYVDGVEVAATYNSTTGTLTPNAPLAEGTHSITYAYKDANGNTSTQSPAFSLTVDTPPIAPTTAISSYDDNAGTITNATSTATTTDDTTPGFNVGAIPADASSIVLYVDGVEVAATYNSTTGTLTPNTPLGEGTHSITYAYKDASGNTSAQSPGFSLTVDTPPVATLVLAPTQVKLEATGVTAGADYQPQITAVGSSGDYVVTYYGVDSNGDNSIFVQKFNADGTTQGSQVKLEATGVTSGIDQLPQITAVGNSGEYVVTYYGTDSDGDFSIFVQKFNADGTTQGSQVKLEATGVTSGADQLPQITAVGSSGEYVVTYLGIDSDGDYSVFVQRFNADGTVQGSQVMLEPTGVTNKNDLYPQITAVGSSGEYVVTYYGVDSNGDTSIFVQKFNADGTTQGSQVKLEATGVTSGIDQLPQITAVGSSGEYVVTYYGVDSNGDNSIFVQKFNADGTVQGSQVMLEPTGVTNKNDLYPQITAVGSSGEYVVTYSGIDSDGDYSVFVQRFNADGTTQGSQVKLEATGVTSGADQLPQITAVGSSGEYVVTYLGIDSDGDYSVFVQRFNADGTVQGSQVMLEPTGVTNKNDLYPQITAVGSSGEYVVTYSGIDSDGDYSVFVQRFNADGTPKGDLIARSSEVGTAYLVNDSVTVTNLASITGAADSLWNSVSITSANSDTAIDKTGLSGGTYHLYSVDTAGNLSLVSTLGTIITTSDTITPMMLDLNGDGVHTTSVSSGVIFDVNADGKAEQTGWSDGKDGFLVLDLNGDAIINDGSELFGEGTTLADGSKAKDGYEALKQYDENGDNIIDVNDLIFSSLQIWIDANVDGKTNSGELYKLEDLNVKSLDLDSQNTTSVDNGNIKGLVSSWTDTNDNSHEMVDVWFKTQEVTQNTISDTSAWTISTVSDVNSSSYMVYANTQIVIDEESKTQNII